MPARGDPKNPTGASRIDWFRTPDWDAQASVAFETRLARARSHNRPQYRRIKALALLETSDADKQQAGRTLLETVGNDPGAHQFDRVVALSCLGAHELEIGRFDDAEGHLRAALNLSSENLTGTSGLENVHLAEILLRRGRQPALEEARGFLDRAASDPPLTLAARFRMSLAGVRVELALGDPEGAGQWARLALELAGATHSGLGNHPRLGLVETDPATKAWLASVADQGTGFRV